MGCFPDSERISDRTDGKCRRGGSSERNRISMTFCAEQEKKKKSIKKTKKGLTNRFFYVIMSIAKIEG